MKNLALSSLILIIPQLLFAASTTALPFEIEFYAPANRFNVEATLIQSCRHEKFVVSNSSEYYTETKNYRLSTETETADSLTTYRVALEQTQHLAIDGFFKSHKGCATQLKIDFIDQNYAVGWAGQFSRPLKFTYVFGEYFKEGHSQFDSSQAQTVFEGKLVDFLYRPVPNLQVNIWLTADGANLPLSPISSAIDPESNMPYRLR